MRTVICSLVVAIEQARIIFDEILEFLYIFGTVQRRVNIGNANRIQSVISGGVSTRNRVSWLCQPNMTR